MLNYWKSIKDYNRSCIMGILVLIIQISGLYLVVNFRETFNKMDELLFAILITIYLVSIPFTMLFFLRKAQGQEETARQKQHDEEYLDVEITYYIVGYYNKQGEFKYFVTHNKNSLNSLNVNGSIREITKTQSFKKEYLSKEVK